MTCWSRQDLRHGSDITGACPLQSLQPDLCFPADRTMRLMGHLLQVSIEVNHCLLVSPGVQKKDVRRVISHYQALAQVENYVRKMPGVTREAVDDTAGAAKMVAQEGWRYRALHRSLSSWDKRPADSHHPKCCVENLAINAISDLLAEHVSSFVNIATAGPDVTIRRVVPILLVSLGVSIIPAVGSVWVCVHESVSTGGVLFLIMSPENMMN